MNNTFGETHVYTAAIPDPNKAAHTADKVLHVSPFFDVSGQYRFAIRVTPEHLKLTVASHGEAGQSHVATIMVKAVPVTDAALLRLAVTQPFASLGVTFGIHWQALRLLLKGAKYHEKPVQKQPRISTASQTKRIPE